VQKSVRIVLFSTILIGLCVAVILFIYLFGKEADRGMQETMRPTQDMRVEGPPDLLVTYREEQLLALGGSYSWHYRNEEGFGHGIEADCEHPLQRKESMPCLKLLDYGQSEEELLFASLEFAVAPDEVSVRCFSVDCWEDTSAKSEELEVGVAEYYADDSSYTADYWIQLREDDYVYVVHAVWNRSESWHGDAQYCFYTER